MKNKAKHNPFNTPECYFEQFDQRLQEKLSQTDMGIPKETGFTVPKGYFEELSKHLEESIRPAPKVIQFRPYKKYFWISASIVAVMLLAIGLGREQPKNVTFSDLALNDIEAYFEDNDLGLSSYEIAEFLPMEEENMVGLGTNDLSEEEMLQYLSDHIESVNELNLENDD